MEKTLVADVMTRDPVIAKPNESLLNCAKMMVRKGVGSLLLVENNKLVGFISQKDILWAMVKKPNADFSKIKAIDISPKKIITVRPDSTLREVIIKMNNSKFDRLPVVDGKEITGMITVRDILSFHPEIYPELEEFAKIREEQEKLSRTGLEKEGVLNEGICEECGEREMLYRINGMLVCESCKNSL
jgi:CBS domain-containing protein